MRCFIVCNTEAKSEMEYMPKKIYLYENKGRLTREGPCLSTLGRAEGNGKVMVTHDTDRVAKYQSI